MRGVRSVWIASVVGLGVAASAAQPTKRPSDAERGEELYRRHCVACHGVRNGGDGPATPALVAEVPDLVGKVTSGEEAIKLVLKGRGAMPGYEASFDRHDAVRVLTFMSGLGPDKELGAAGRPKSPKGVAGPDPDAEGGEPADEP